MKADGVVLYGEGRYRYDLDAAHACCNDATVVDTENDNEPLCECTTREVAERICTALNR